jgi:hypothetical protein
MACQNEKQEKNKKNEEKRGLTSHSFHNCACLAAKLQLRAAVARMFVTLYGIK